MLQKYSDLQITLNKGTETESFIVVGDLILHYSDFIIAKD